MPNLIEKIERIALRDVWAHEAHHFTRWLADNLDVLSGTIGIELTLVEREASAGEFSLDLLAEDKDGRTVIIENQLGKSDHDHLGKLLTYLAAFEATVAVWIVGEPRAEHTKAVAWLNDSTPIDVYLLRAEAVRIGSSPPALLLTPVIGPSEAGKVVAKEKQERSERHIERRAFWTELLPKAASKTPLHRNISPSDDNWLTASSGVPHFYYLYRIGTDWTRVSLEIYHPQTAWNKAAFSALREKQGIIESRFGGPLIWDDRPGVRGAWISREFANRGYRSPHEHFASIQDEMIDAMIRLEKAVAPELRMATSTADRVMASGAEPTRVNPQVPRGLAST